MKTHLFYNDFNQENHRPNCFEDMDRPVESLTTSHRVYALYRDAAYKPMANVIEYTFSHSSYTYFLFYDEKNYLLLVMLLGVNRQSILLYSMSSYFAFI